MKIALFGIPDIKTGKHNLKDPRLDQAHALVEADKETQAQVDVIGPDEWLDADVILASRESKADLILEDLEFVETRLGRDPQPEERIVLEKLPGAAGKRAVRSRGRAAGGGAPGRRRPQLLHRQTDCGAAPEELRQPETLLLRAFADGGYVCFLTVGGKENRAWPIRQGTTAWEAAGSIHTDMQKGFIRAEIISFADFIAAGGETQAKRAGKLRLETKQYLVRDYDLVNFRFNK